jgi:oligopeptide/dipeptide ABC transporter ATP-binding protein
VSTPAPILAVQGLGRHFTVRNIIGTPLRTIKALDDVSFEVRPGETLGVVGESGCGKTTLGKTLAGIHAPSFGAVRFEGVEITSANGAERRAIAKRLQYIHQDPGNALDPRWTIRRSLEEPLLIHTTLARAEREAVIGEILAAVGLPATHLDLYPHELSGGQQRRVGLARILTLKPRLVILDEPTSGLDVSVQATVLKLIRSLSRSFDLTYLFISHDLAVVRMMCDRVAVMYLGRIVEIAPAAELFDNPRHPYTRSLLSAIPQIGGRRVTDTFVLEGEPPDPGRLPSGCRFRARCPKTAPICAEREPGLEPAAAAHATACHFPGDASHA